MNRRLSITAVALLLAAAASAFPLNYNASKSNTGNLLVHPTSVTEAQATAILASLDKGAKSRQAPNQAVIQGYIKAAGVKQGVIKSILIESNQGKTTVLLLDDSADEKTARDALSKAAGSRSNTQHN